MRRRLGLVFVALCTTVALVAGAPAAEATTIGVSMSGFAYTPASIKAKQAKTVTWTQNDSGATHTATSNQGFWDSGNLAKDATFSITADFSGTFAYHCTVHPFMKGDVRTPLRAIAQNDGSYIIRWSRLTTTPGNRSFDVQIKRPGEAYTSYRDATTTREAMFSTDIPGIYKFRARTRNLSNATTSDWSPVLTLTFT